MRRGLSTSIQCLGRAAALVLVLAMAASEARADADPTLPVIEGTKPDETTLRAAAFCAGMLIATERSLIEEPGAHPSLEEPGRMAVHARLAFGILTTFVARNREVIGFTPQAHDAYRHAGLDSLEALLDASDPGMANEAFKRASLCMAWAFALVASLPEEVARHQTAAIEHLAPLLTDW